MPKLSPSKATKAANQAFERRLRALDALRLGAWVRKNYPEWRVVFRKDGIATLGWEKYRMDISTHDHVILRHWVAPWSVEDHVRIVQREVKE